MVQFAGGGRAENIAGPESQEALTIAKVATAVELWPMPRETREKFKSVAEGETELEDIATDFEATREAASKKVEAIGLSLEQYQRTYEALTELQSIQETGSGDEDRAEEHWQVVQQMMETSTEGIANYIENLEGFTPTKELHGVSPSGPEVGLKAQEYSDARQDFHEQIITGKMENCPSKDPPKIVFLIGPPGGGKSSAREQLTDEFVSTDPDALRAKLYGEGFDQTNYAHTEATQQEAFDVSSKIFEQAMSDKRNILYEGTGANYEGYVEDMKKCQEAGYEVELKFVYTPPGECLRRSVAYRDRAVPVPFLMQSLRSFYNVLKFANDGEPPMEVIDNSDVLPRAIESGDNEFMDKLGNLAKTYVRE